jgi:hypothetical protein
MQKVAAGPAPGLTDPQQNPGSSHATEDGEFEVSIPKRVPPNLEEEMDFDADGIKSGIRIAEFY